MHSELLLLPLLSVGLNLPDYFACCQTYSTHRKSSSCSVVVHLSSGSLLRPSSSSFTLLGILTLFTSASCSCSCATPDVGNLLSICCDCKECHLGLSLLQSVSPLFVPLNLVPFKVARSQLTHCCCRSTSARLYYCGSTSCSSTSMCCYQQDWQLIHVLLELGRRHHRRQACWISLLFLHSCLPQSTLLFCF